MKIKSTLIVMILSTFLVSAPAGTQVVELAKANFYLPPANTVWNIQYPLNSTYVSNCLTLRFSVETNLGLLYFYSIDGQERKEINTTTISKVPLPEYPPFIDGSLWNRRTEEGTSELPYLSKGTHELAIYQIYPLSKDNPENGNIVSKALVIFNVTGNLPLENLLLTPNPSPSPMLTPSPSLSPTPSLSPIPSPSSSQIANPTLTPSQSATSSFGPIVDPGTNPFPFIMGISAIVIVAIVGLTIYFARFRKK